MINIHTDNVTALHMYMKVTHYTSMHITNTAVAYTNKIAIRRHDTNNSGWPLPPFAQLVSCVVVENDHLIALVGVPLHVLTVASVQLSPVGRLLQANTQVDHAGLDRFAQAGADVSRRRNDTTPPTTTSLHPAKQHVLARPVELLDGSGRLRMPRRRDHWTAPESTQQFLGQLTAAISAVVAVAVGGDPHIGEQLY